MRIIAVMSPKGGIGKTTTSDSMSYSRKWRGKTWKTRQYKSLSYSEGLGRLDVP